MVGWVQGQKEVFCSLTVSGNHFVVDEVEKLLSVHNVEIVPLFKMLWMWQQNHEICEVIVVENWSYIVQSKHVTL